MSALRGGCLHSRDCCQLRGGAPHSSLKAPQPHRRGSPLMLLAHPSGSTSSAQADLCATGHPPGGWGLALLQRPVKYLQDATGAWP